MPRQQRKVPWLALRGGVYYVFWYDGYTKKPSAYHFAQEKLMLRAIATKPSSPMAALPSLDELLS